MDSISLRAPEPRDANLIYIWENSSDESHSSFRPGPLSRAQINSFIENYDGEIYSQGALRFMIDVEEQTVGTVDVFDYDHRARHAFVGIYVSPQFRRHGLAMQALKAIEKHMYRRVGMYSLAALVADDNIPSRRLFNKAGFKVAGTMKGWFCDGTERVDALVYQKILS